MTCRPFDGLCACGCGGQKRKGRKFISGHNLISLTDEQKEKKRQSNKRVFAEGRHPWVGKDRKGANSPLYGKSQLLHVRQAVAEANKKRVWTEEAKLKMSRNAKVDFQNGNRVSSFTKLGNGRSSSSFEKVVLSFLSPMGFSHNHPVPFDKGCYHIDFADPIRLIAIELDSKLHLSSKAKQVDSRKDKFLASKGWKVIRVPFYSKQCKPDDVLKQVKEIIRNENYQSGGETIVTQTRRPRTRILIRRQTIS